MSILLKPQPGRNYWADNANTRLEPLFGCKGFVTQFPIKLDGKALEVALGSRFLTRGGTDLQDCLLSVVSRPGPVL